jgi:hypothetical protein
VEASRGVARIGVVVPRRRVCNVQAIDDDVLDVAAHGGVIKSEYSILYGAVAVIFLVSSLQLSYDKLRQNATNWRLHIITQGTSFLLIPAIQLGKGRQASTSFTRQEH